MKILNIILAISMIYGCNSQKEEEDTDSTPTATVTRSESITIEFVDTHFYDLISKTWISIKKDDIKNKFGNIGTIPVYTNLINTSVADAMASISKSDEQFADQEGFLASEFNSIPFFRIKAEAGKIYTFNYIKFDNNTNIKEETTGTMLVNGGFAYLPLVNEIFANRLQSGTVTSQSSNSFDHKISFAAQSNTSKASVVEVINFKLKLEVPVKDFVVKFSDEAEAFTLATRWNHYFNGSDGVANPDWPFVSLVEDQETPEALPLDIRIVFKAPPVLSMTQKIFVEETIDTAFYKATGTPFATRGNSYFQKSVQLNSTNDFQRRVKINGIETALTGDREAILRNLAPGQKWEVQFSFNFEENPNFTVGQNLLTPLRPECRTVNNTPFNPIQEMTAKKANEAAGGFTSICHPSLDATIIKTASQLATFTDEKTDAWFAFFSYIPSAAETEIPRLKVVDHGHFFGIRDVTMSTSGCLRIYTREASANEINPNSFELKNTSSPECDDGTNDDGWVYFNISKTYSIFDQIGNFTTTTGLEDNIKAFSTAVPKNRSDFYFNGDDFTDRIY
jgi:hypothetical protein